MTIRSGSTIEDCVATGASPHGGGVSVYYTAVSVTNSSLRRNSVAVAASTAGPFDRVAELAPFGSGAGGAFFLVFSSLTLAEASEARARTLCSIMKCTSCFSSKASTRQLVLQTLLRARAVLPGSRLHILMCILPTHPIMPGVCE